MKINIGMMLRKARRRENNAVKQRISDVAQWATLLQKGGLTRTEALRMAEKSIPHRTA